MDYQQLKSKFSTSKISKAKPLKGIRVVEAGQMVSAPFAAVLLADFGAEVIKIEHPTKGDGQRKLNPFKDEIPLWWKTIARNKSLVSLDLSQKKGIAVFEDILKNTDVLIENFRPGTLVGWGLTSEKIREIDPRIVVLSISGFGQTGPSRERAGFGRIAEALGGLSNLIGEPDGPPMLPGYPLGDLITGLFGAFSVMVALHERNHISGLGQDIDLAMNEAILRLLEFDPIQYDQTGEIHSRTGNAAAYVAPSSTYKTKDGKYVTMAASTQSVWERLCKAMDSEYLISHPKFLTNKERLKNSIEINSIVSEWMKKHEFSSINVQFNKHKVAYAPVYDISDIFADPQFQARESLIKVPDDELEEPVVQNVVPKFSRTPGSVDFLGGSIGRDNYQFYSKILGYSEKKITKLKKHKII